MSDKSKLGFNINPKKYDELNSTDNIITSGSDSGWLGKKLHGDNNNLDLSKINPLFDKDLYEKYRPGVNTNDGSVNQDIWGYKCFNNPVSFRNGIYGDTYSITEQKSSGETIDLVPETYATIKSDTTIKNKIYNRTENNANNYSEYTYKKYHGPVDYDNSQFTYMNTVIPDSDEHTISDIIIKSHSESHCDNNAFAINDEYERTLCSVRPNYYVASAPDVSDAQHVFSVNYANTQYERKLQAYTPAVNTDNYFVTREKNVTTTFSMYANSPYMLDYGDEPETGANILLKTNCTETFDGVVSNRYATLNIASPNYDTSSVTLLAKNDSNECNIEVRTDYVQIGATDGNLNITNDNFSRMFVSNNRINKSISGNALAIDYHVKDIETTYMNNTVNVSGPAIDITFDYRKTTINGSQDSSIETYCVEAAYPAKFQNVNGVASINVHGIYMFTDANNVPTYKDYCGTYITPTSVTTNGLQFDLIDWPNVTELHSYAHNKLAPIEYKFKFNDNDPGIGTDGLQLISCKSGGKTTFICDYLVVNESIKYKPLSAYADRLVYIDPETNSTADVLTVQSNNLILPCGDKEVTIGGSNSQLNKIYAYKFIGTADKAKADEYGRNIAETYFDNSSNNTITGITTISRAGDVLRILPNSVDEEDRCSINITNSDVYMQCKTTLNMHQQDNTNLACSLSLYAYHNKDVSSFSILPSVERTAGDTLISNVALNIGGKNNYFTNIYCKNFPTVHNTLIGQDAFSGGSGNLQTNIGCIRLLCIEVQNVTDAVNNTMLPGFAIRDGKITIDGNDYLVYLAGFRAEISNNNIRVAPISNAPVTGSWYSLSGIFLEHNSGNYIKYIPILAIRSY